ncbi:MAG: hypothetical protein H6817_06405 [Phycisphaerales bacterium]|nr:hypothetical protein [Phycisphaerales bacterium]
MFLGASPISDLPWQLVVGIVVTTTTLIYMTRRRSMRAAARPRPSATQRALNTSRTNAAGDLRELMLDVEKLTREATAQIETRYRKLETVLRDADKRIRELERLTGVSRSSNKEPASRVTPSVPETPQRIDFTVGEDGVTELSHATDPQLAQSTPERPQSNPVSKKTPTPARATDDRTAVYDRVCSLADNNLPAREIAARVDRPIGEVELMLGLRAQRSAAGG